MKNVYTLLLAVFIFSIVTLFQAPDTLWTRKIGGTGIDVGNEIIQTSDGGFVIAGYTTSFGAIQRDSYIIKLDSSAALSGLTDTEEMTMKQQYLLKKHRMKDTYLQSFFLPHPVFICS